MKRHPGKLRLRRETLRTLDLERIPRRVRGGIEDSKLCCEELLTVTCNLSENCTDIYCTQNC